MINCFVAVYKHLDKLYGLPHKWHGYTVDDMDLFVKDQKKFLARRDHIAFFRSFCERVKSAKKDDIVLTKGSVGCAINRFTYWVYSEDTKGIIHKKIDKDCLIMRFKHG